MVNSIKEKLFSRLWPIFAIAVLIAAILAFVFGLWNVRVSASGSIERLISERGQYADQGFREIDRVQTSANSSFRAVFENLSEADVERHFEQIFLLREDGSRRSSDAFFDGHFYGDLGWTHGLAAFIPSWAEIDPVMKRGLVSAALSIMQQSSAAKTDSIQNLYYVNADLGSIVIFAPTRPDQLKWYRYDMPAEHDIMSGLNSGARNFVNTLDFYREGTECDGIGTATYDQTGRTLTSMCSHPTDSHLLGRDWIDFFGMTRVLTPYDQLDDQMVGQMKIRSFTLGRDGRPIFHSDLQFTDRVSKDDFDALEAKYDFPSIHEKILNLGETSGVVSVGDFSLVSGLIGFYRHSGTDHISVIELPYSSLAKDAFSNFLVVFFASMLLGLIVSNKFLFEVKSIMLTPLSDLARLVKQTNAEADSQDDINYGLSVFYRRKDEIGLVASAIQKYRDDVSIAMDTIQQQKAEVESALQTEINVNEMQNQFVSTVSHEIRTPLAIIDGSASRVERKVERMSFEDIKARMHTIRDSVGRLTSLMERTLETSKLAAGRIELKPASFDLSSMLETLVTHQKELSPQHTIELDSSGLSDTFYGDRKLLELVFANLLSNAVKYSPNNPNVSVRAIADDDKVTVKVCDYGVGIPADELPKISERFFRARTSAGIQGTGIGLNLVKMLVDEHSGTMSVDSDEGCWTEFTITLPIYEEIDLEDFEEDAA